MPSEMTHKVVVAMDSGRWREAVRAEQFSEPVYSEAGYVIEGLTNGWRMYSYLVQCSGKTEIRCSRQ